MFKQKRKELNELTVLTEIIKQMEENGDGPEVLIRNIQLVGQIIKILESFQSEMEERLTKS
jgi:benzoyl-CoA reductase/2-hydroxyglutaryl-CoA dehydratase subunit BcrC/BadD/HgdB